jgi:hypothetical protein
VRNDFSQLPIAEILLLDALSGMLFEFGWEAHNKLKTASTFGLALAVMAMHGLYKQKDDEEGLWDEEGHSLLWQHKNALQDKLQNEGSVIDTDLDARSQYLLVVLAGLAEQTLMHYPNYIWHNHFSAGQAAMCELERYDLIFVDERGLGYWTDKGKEMLQQVEQLAEFPA